jgi:hypothetical protein
MKKVRLTLKALTLMAFMLAFSALANAQATRTWVSGTGDDANPCSRTAPCKTFAGAISKTAEGGEIDALDPGGYGTLSITKSITIDGGTGQGWASVLASSSAFGFSINTSTAVNHPNDAAVTIRNVSVNGTGQYVSPGTNGIRVLHAQRVSLENVTVFGFSSNGVDFEPDTAGSELRISNSTISENGGDGVLMKSVAGVSSGNISNTSLLRNSNGIEAQNNIKATAYNVVATGGTGSGFFASVSGAEVNAMNSEASHNQDSGVKSSAGATARVATSFIINNSTGLNINGGSLCSAGDNVLSGNPVPGSSNCAVTKL